MAEVKIKKARIKEALFLDVEYTEDLPGHSKKDTKLSCTVPVHEDLTKSFEKLHKHLALLCDEISLPPKVKKLEAWDGELLASFSVQGFSIGGSGDTEGVTLSGRKDATYGVVNLNTPFQKWDGSEYKFIHDLSADIEACIYEVDQYLFAGKRAPEQQLAMEFGVGGDIGEGEE